MEQSGFKFLGFRVPEFSMEVKDPYLLGQSIKNDLSVNVQNNFSKENNRFVEVYLGIKIINSEGYLKINFTIKGGFLADSEMSEEVFKQMYSINAPAILFPYARAIISSITSQAGIPQVILPLMNFTNTFEQPKETAVLAKVD